MATIDKFGVLTAHALGSAEIAVDSWNDANPLSANAQQTFSRTGIQDTIHIRVVSGTETVERPNIRRGLLDQNGVGGDGVQSEPDNDDDRALRAHHQMVE